MIVHKEQKKVADVPIPSVTDTNKAEYFEEYTGLTKARIYVGIERNV